MSCLDESWSSKMGIFVPSLTPFKSLRGGAPALNCLADNAASTDCNRLPLGSAADSGSLWPGTRGKTCCSHLKHLKMHNKSFLLCFRAPLQYRPPLCYTACSTSWKQWWAKMWLWTEKFSSWDGTVHCSILNIVSWGKIIFNTDIWMTLHWYWVILELGGAYLTLRWIPVNNITFQTCQKQANSQAFKQAEVRLYMDTSARNNRKHCHKVQPPNTSFYKIVGVS